MTTKQGISKERITVFFKGLYFLLLVTIPNRVEANDNYLVPYEETAESYEEFPQDSISQALLQTRPPGSIPKVTMSLWTTAVDFRHPLMYLLKGIVRRLDKELLIFQPQYFIRSGTEEGCRDLDPVTGQEIENPACQRNCTNHGRYCAASLPSESELSAKINGAAIVEESLRRLCVWVVYGKTGGDNSLHFFRYVNDLLFQQCDSPFGKNCTYSIMKNIGVGSHFIERCMNHTHGLDVDDDNSYLQEQLNRRENLNLSQVPALKIGNDWYQSEHSTAAIFRAVCAAYPPGTQQPMACDFCQDCDDVRYCLWFLQCDGTSFETYASDQLSHGYLPNNSSSSSSTISEEGQPENSGPETGQSDTTEDSSRTGGTTSLPAEPNYNVNHDENRNNNPQEISSAGYENNTNNDDDLAEASLLQGVFVGLAVGLVVSVVCACRDWQAKLVLREITLAEGTKAANDLQNLDGSFSSLNNSFLHNSFTPTTDAVLEPEDSDETTLPHGHLA